MKGYLDVKELESYKKADIQKLARDLGVSDAGTIKEIAARCAAVEIETGAGEPPAEPGKAAGEQAEERTGQSGELHGKTAETGNGKSVMDTGDAADGSAGSAGGKAEAGGEDINGRILVANVILNRVQSEAFPNTVEGVVFQKHNGRFQFSPIYDGRYNRVKISEETVEAVERALAGEDYSKGALYFVSRKGAAPDKMRWFDNHLTRLFQYGGHEFFA